MTRCGLALCDFPERMPWTALRSFTLNLDARSALARDIAPKEYGDFFRPGREVVMLADLIDAVQAHMYVTQLANTPRGKTRQKAPRTYPRPGAKDGGARRGRDAIPISQFDSWWNGGDA